MTKSTCLLLVEGENDQRFYKKICERLGLNNDVTVATPKDDGGKYNSKQGAINHLRTLLNQLADGQKERLGLVIDADYDSDGNGFKKTVELITSQLEEYEFDSKYEHLEKGGIVFRNNDGFANFGLWVMPNNKDQGALENWVSDCVSQSEKELFAHAKNSVNELREPKFNQTTKTDKANIATWLAWQKDPGSGLSSLIKAKLLDEDALAYIGLKEWLVNVFGKATEP